MPADFDADLDSPFPNSPFLAGAAWYLGQVICRQRDSVWLHWAEDPAAEPGSHHHPDNPWSGIPFTHQPHRRKAQAIDPTTELRGLVRHGDGYHLRDILDSVH
ncbi:hypothetical protein KV557_38185 [Kitasatospora aureofaciens]|uniref:hypothetical protein n=1 Tax=Kitasatospora aureofaciens TaxID=1894 RepID=UPI001C46C33E|nr:hypothetical protein [Kitasatospora aureofaciens]MBV6702863.1 hypothetical protein [Kitasatospora aureofaciens]